MGEADGSASLPMVFPLGISGSLQEGNMNRKVTKRIADICKQIRNGGKRETQLPTT